MMRICEGSSHGLTSRKTIEGDPLVAVVAGEDYHPDYQAVRYREARVVRLSLVTERNEHFTVEITRGIVELIIEAARREGWIKDAAPQIATELATTPKPDGSALLPRMPLPDHIHRRE